MANTFRVYNRCNYDIGCVLPNGLERNVEAGNFQLMTDDEIMFVENKCKVNKFFAQRMLVPVDDDGNDVPLDKLHIVKPVKANVHLDDEEIAGYLRMSNTKLEKWLETVTDPAELHSIYLVAKNMDTLTKSKLEILQAKIPNKDWASDPE